MIEIRPATDADFKGIWRIFHTVVVAGDTYAFDPGTNEEQAFRIWMSPDWRTYVATSEGKIVGTYLLKPNQPGLGSHVANAAFMVDPVAQGQGLGEAMGRHAWRRRRGWATARCNSTSSSARMSGRSDYGRSSASRSSAPCPRRSATGASAMLTRT